MVSTSITAQVWALLKKNYIIKKRTKNQTIQEFLLPVYFVAILAIIKMTSSQAVVPAVPGFPAHKLQPFAEQLKGAIFFTSPDTPEVKSRMNKLMNVLHQARLNTSYEVFPDAQAAEDYYVNSTGYRIGLDWHSSSNYTLRFSYGSTPMTDSTFGTQGACRNLSGLGVCPGNQYLYSGFASLQNVINTLLIREKSLVASFPIPDLQVQLFPKAKFEPNNNYIQTLSSIYFVMAYSPFVSFLVMNLVTEKEKKIKEGMRMMGMKSSAFWISWGVTYVIIITIVTVLIAILAFAVHFFSSSSTVWFFLFMLLYGFSIITFSMMLTPFLNKAEVAGGMASLATLVVSLLSLAVTMTTTLGPDGPVSTVPPGGQWVLCLFSPVALALGIYQMVYLDIADGGASFANLGIGQFPLYAPLTMLAVDILLYGLLALYFDNIHPGEYGQRQPYLFFLLPSYWCPGKKGTSAKLFTHQPIVADPNIAVEEVTADLMDKNVFRIKNLSKVFDSGKEQVRAVDGISLDIYEGQITALLGHNGAGKTTLINMMTGLFAPSGGSASLYGHNVADPNDMTEIRSMMGVCPQHNILFDMLSCVDHLQLYGTLRGIPTDQLQSEIDVILKHVDLLEQKDTYSKKLSGGQKRKLSVAIALIGDPKVIYLDEPTAGMDAYSRRHLWSLLKARRPGKVILLTTHFMDEADILADRKAIISKGKLKCVGSSLFLKSNFGLGYHLSLVVDKDIVQVTDLVQHHIPEAVLGRMHGAEVMYTLPSKSMQAFSGLFSALEKSISSNDMGINAYGISMTTLEEVFLKIGLGEKADVEDTDKAADAPLSVPLISSPHQPGTANQQLLGANLTMEQRSCEVQALDPSTVCTHQGDPVSLKWQQFSAICKVRFNMVRRNPLVIFFRIVMPVIFIIISAAVAKYTYHPPTSVNIQPLQFSPDLYPHDMIVQVVPPVGHNTTLEHFIAGVKAQKSVFMVTKHTNLTEIQPHNVGMIPYNITQKAQNIYCRATALYNDTATHSLPVTISVISNALLSAAGYSHSLTVATKPWPSPSNVFASFNNAAFSSVLLLSMSMVIMPPGFTFSVVQDRYCRAKMQLRVVGVTMNMYWGTTFFVDFIQYCLVAICSIIVVLAFQVPSLLYAGAMLSLSLLYLVFMPANMLFAYVFSFAFDKPETTMSLMLNFFIIGGLLPFFAVLLMDMLGAFHTASILHYVFCMIDPPYNIFGGCYYIARVYLKESITQLTSTPSISVGTYFLWDSNIDICILMCIMHCLLLYIGLRVLESYSTGATAQKVLGCSGQGAGTSIPEDNLHELQQGDEDVRHEREAVSAVTTDTPVVMVKNLRKEFRKDTTGSCFDNKSKESKIKVAVANNSFLVPPGEVFGLLGPNGAGKTTTLNMIVAEERPTCGRIFVDGQDVLSNPFEAFVALGYCPQHDALWDNITLLEHLQCYAACRGVHVDDSGPLAQYFINSLNMTEHMNKHSKKLSGGTKRKLSFSMSMLGFPRVVLMDEPSTGLDPTSKRFLWDTISATFRGSERGAILTTHYMEEADALCTRVGIMVNGELQCIGTTQHLKNKYGSGYILEVKLTGEDLLAPAIRSPTDTRLAIHQVSPQMQALQDMVQTMFPDATVAECFGTRVVYKVLQDSVGGLSQVFSKLQNSKEELNIEDYSFSQSTLEQVFLEFAKRQHEADELTVTAEA